MVCLDLVVSSFFSLHRPISVSHYLPKAVTDDVFSNIFKPRAKSSLRTTDVISTLSSTVNVLESQAQREQWDNEAEDLRAAINSESQQHALHLDGAPQSSLALPTHVLAGAYRPFSPPPPPVPMNTAQSLQAGAEAAEVYHTPQRKTYTAVLTVQESTNAAGEVTYTARSSPLIAEDPPAVPARFLERMNIRQERYNEYREQRAEDTGMWAISVKRQRKLKMKKHKYKKLMKRTRNLRRRLDRT